MNSDLQIRRYEHKVYSGNEGVREAVAASLWSSVYIILSLVFTATLRPVHSDSLTGEWKHYTSLCRLK